MKTHKTVFRRFEYVQCDDMARYLDYMSEQGWQFASFGTVGLSFEHDPGRWHYVVEILSDGRERDWGPSEAVRDYAQYCDATGYEFVDSRGKMCVFRYQGEEPVDCFTEEERFYNVRSSARTTMLMTMAAAVLIALVNTPILPLLGIHLFGMGVDEMLDGPYLYFNASIWLGMIIFTGKRVVDYFYVGRCYKKADGKAYYGRNQHKNASAKGIYPLVEKLFVLLIVLTGVYWCMVKHYYFAIIIMAIYIIVIFLPRLIAARFKLSGSNSFAFGLAAGFVAFVVLMTMQMYMIMNEKTAEKIARMIDSGRPVFVEEDMPLTVEDLFGEKDQISQIIDYDATSSLLGTMREYNISFKKYELNYRVYQSNQPWLLAMKWREELSETKSEQKYLGILRKNNVNKQWKVKEAYEAYYLVDESMPDTKTNRFGEKHMIYSDHAIFVLYDGGELTPEQIETIKEKIGLN